MPSVRNQEPYTNGAAVTPHDTNALSHVSNALWVGGAGNITVEFEDETTALLVGVPAGTLLPLQVNKVHSTGTTATSIVNLWS